MAQTWLISGPPGCGKTTWMLNALSSHQGPRGYLRLAGVSTAGLEQAVDGGIDLTYLQDQITDLIDLSNGDQASSRQEEQLNLVELSQFHPPASSGLEGVAASAGWKRPPGRCRQPPEHHKRPWGSAGASEGVGAWPRSKDSASAKGFRERRCCSCALVAGPDCRAL